jgi:hypothetical protein
LNISGSVELYSALEHTYQQLQQGQEIELADLRAKLGVPKGSVLLSASDDIEIYDQHLMVTSAGRELAGISLFEGVLSYLKISNQLLCPGVLGQLNPVSCLMK